ncbi:hypothetical protein DMH12_37290 [Streptomyces sp. WAC 04229]|uniref:hypothetical protein n=1 Tax=Streptomyces sp. WAC 04229 TaxID=2203206 RepID=UPI000F740E38|nr:hypothetical protein [Streptomyces sp. WAC 04229]RSN38804.1 hypothetical protein DMH12_37290 [Streptomyces sp. WAC 04229]
MTPQNELRLLRWSGPDGKPCHLSTDDSGGYMSRLADNIEAVQLVMATDLLERAVGVLGDQDAGRDDLRLMLTEVTRTLRDVVPAATSRGHLLAVSELQF